MKKIVLAITGASGAIYFQRLLDLLKDEKVEFHIIISNSAKIVIAEELEEQITFPKNSIVYNNNDISAKLASGSFIFDSMCIIPCSMGTIGKISSGIADNLITRTADVALKEKRKLLLCARETPFNLIHLQNMTTLAQAGAQILPACVSFYNKPESLLDIVDSFVHRIMDNLGFPCDHAFRWEGKKEGIKKTFKHKIIEK